MSFTFQCTSYPTETARNQDAAYEWFTAAGNNSLELALEYATDDDQDLPDCPEWSSMVTSGREDAAAQIREEIREDN